MNHDNVIISTVLRKSYYTVALMCRVLKSICSIIEIITMIRAPIKTFPRIINISE